MFGLQLLFWFSLIFILYAYFGYPLILRVITLFRTKPVRKGNITPAVTFIIAAFNEERRIEEKIRNTLELEYPRDSLEIMVASDNSADATDEIVRLFEGKGVKLIRAEERRGKEYAQMLAVRKAGGEILVFSDVATSLVADGLRTIVSNFNDPTVGCVSSVDRFIDGEGKLSGEGFYVKYEMFLRELETNANSLVGLSGSFFAARKEVCDKWSPDLQSDFNTLLNSVKRGMRGVSDSSSIGYYRNIIDPKKEFERKVRTVLRGISVFMQSLPLVNVFKYGFFSWQLISHKLCRWLVPFFALVMLISNAVLIFRGGTFLIFFMLQGFFYAFAIIGEATHLFKNRTILRIPSFFLLVNLSILVAWCRYIKGERLVKWTPSER
jgi:cellulose synthase/poly-beta-1,6-N-acetylglucosamine synthase-like glycosyltransferase